MELLEAEGRNYPRYCCFFAVVATIASFAVACTTPPARWSDAPGAQHAAVAATEIGDSLRVWIEAPDSVRLGDLVPIRLIVENVSQRTITLHLGGDPLTFELVIQTPDGQIVWNRLYGQPVLTIEIPKELRSGERLTFSDKWEQQTNAAVPDWRRQEEGEQVPAGFYLIRGSPNPLSVGGAIWSPAARIQISP